MSVVRFDRDTFRLLSMRVGTRESRSIIWHSYPLDHGDTLLRSGDKRWTIIQGTQHFTLLDNGAAVFRCSSQDGAIEEAARRCKLNEQ